jgi:hypothetical protein
LFGSTAGTADVQSTQGTEVTTGAVTMVDVSLTVNTHVYVAWLIGDKDMAQLATKYSLNEEYANAAKGLVTQSIEKALAALWSSLGAAEIGDTTTVLSDAEIVQAIYTIDNLNYDLTECGFFFHPLTC